MSNYAPEVLISEEEIKLRIQELAKAITFDFGNKEIVVICVLKGAFMFCADLIKKVECPLRLEFISLSSYQDQTFSSGNVVMEMDLTGSIEGKDVLIVEDIVDSGLTIKTLLEMLNLRRPKSIRLASLLYKPSRLKHSVTINYLGFEIEDKFVVGYGLDYMGRYREIPYIGVLSAGN